jgi:flagellin-like protein
MKIVNKGKRKAISPVLATVILIAITLIAAVAIAGFVFGLFGSFTSSAQVSAQVTSCTYAATNNVCNVVLTNSGTSNTVATSCSINIGGAAKIGAVSGVTLISASSTAAAICTVNPAGGSAAQTVGSQAVGSFGLSNGASVPFSGVWS